jgi:hypothetical protein
MKQTLCQHYGEEDMDRIDVHDLPEEQAQLVQEFIEFLRRKRQTDPVTRDDEALEGQAWSAGAHTGFATDWENDADAVYDTWKEHYHVEKR